MKSSGSRVAIVATIAGLLVVIIIVESCLLSGYSLTGILRPPPLNADMFFDPCDPYALLERAAKLGKNFGRRGKVSENGIFHVSKSLIDNTCKTAPKSFSDNLALLKSQVSSLPAYLQNKMILLIGDSFERRLIEQICKHSNGTITKAMLNGAVYPEYTVGGGDPHACVIRKEAKVLVLISIFNFGVRVEQNPPFGKGDHWLAEFSPFEVRKRVNWIPYFLLAIANHTFPELCYDHICPPSTSHTNLDRVQVWNSSQPFWFPAPDMVVAQSGIWDLKQRNLKFVSKRTPKLFADSWGLLLKSELLDPLKEVLRFSGENYVPSSNVDANTSTSAIIPHPRRRWFARTLPFSLNTQFPAHYLAKMNDILRKDILFNRDAFGSTDYGLLDWEALVEFNRNWVIGDGFHPNERSNEAYWQYLLSRMELLGN
ncbi:hypothetical protein HK100_011798 [Physocladia obscura]|uniref:Uncharacterized protein n=1 Tax=Physocladia obscura TaxID=109957 RepID=A0AAD5T1N3_9FUNG|nr:hypothetical protein HK100_011798 [Physocladia obscura]